MGPMFPNLIKGRKLTVGHLRKLLDNLPTNAKILPDWWELPDDDDPCVEISAIDIGTNRGKRPYLSVMVALHPLED